MENNHIPFLYKLNRIRPTYSNVVACYLMILNYFNSDIELTKDVENKLYSEFKRKCTDGLYINNIINYAKRLKINAKVINGWTREDIVEKALLEHKVVLLGGISEGQPFERIVCGITKLREFWILDSRLKYKEVYPSSLLKLLSLTADGRWCVVFSEMG